MVCWNNVSNAIGWKSIFLADYILLKPAAHLPRSAPLVVHPDYVSSCCDERLSVRIHADTVLHQCTGHIIVFPIFNGGPPTGRSSGIKMSADPSQDPA
jgi:hypothetical protein